MSLFKLLVNFLTSPWALPLAPFYLMVMFFNSGSNIEALLMLSVGLMLFMWAHHIDTVKEYQPTVTIYNSPRIIIEGQEFEIPKEEPEEQAQKGVA